MVTGGGAAWLKPSRSTSKTDGTASPYARDALLARLEAVLLLSSQPQGSRRLAELADLADGTKARTLIRKLNRFYDAQGSAFRVEEVAGGFQLRTRSAFAPWLRRLHSVPVEIRLSAPAIETLAVIAYRQPALRAEIEAIRGVQCGEILRQLIERDLVRIVGRSDELGRPFLYGTSRQFLEVFGLRHLDELPRADLLRSDAAGHHISTQNVSFHELEEETHVKALDTTCANQEELAERTHPAAFDEMPRRDLRAEIDDDPDEEDEFDDDDDFDDDDYDEEDDDFDDDEDEDEDEDEVDDEDIDDEDVEDEWEEVEDDDEEEEEEEWDEDEDWDDDEDYDDDDFDEDDEDEEEDEEEGEE
jgi:segregation and condensation protein B